jgi:hypothetical protein
MNVFYLMPYFCTGGSIVGKDVTSASEEPIKGREIVAGDAGSWFVRNPVWLLTMGPIVS